MYYDLIVYWFERGFVVFDFLSCCLFIVCDGECFVVLMGDVLILVEKVWVFGFERIDLLNEGGCGVLLCLFEVWCDCVVGIVECMVDWVFVGSLVL